MNKAPSLSNNAAVLTPTASPPLTDEGEEPSIRDLHPLHQSIVLTKTPSPPTSIGTAASPVTSRDFAVNEGRSSNGISPILDHHLIGHAKPISEKGIDATGHSAPARGSSSQTYPPDLKVQVDRLNGSASTSDAAATTTSGTGLAPSNASPNTTINVAAALNPRIKALKNLVRSNSEPALASASAGQTPVYPPDLEKGGAGVGAGLGPRPALVQAPLSLQGLLEPNKKLRPPPTWKTSAWNIVKYSWLNVLLVFIPVSWALHFTGANDTAIFCTSFAAIIPLAALLGFATEEMALRVGHTLGGLMNATFGNTVELIIAILALVKGELRVVQSSMIGSILSNCLLVLGCCFFAGGIRFHEQIYTIRSAQLNISLLGISALVIVIPAAFRAAVDQLGDGEQGRFHEGDILKLSRGVAFILLFVYASYLFFQLWTHSYLYTSAAVVTKRSTLHRQRTIEDFDEPQPPAEGTVLRLPSWHSHSSDSSSSHHEGEDATGEDGNGLQRRVSNSTSTTSSSSDSSDDDSEEPKLKVLAAVALIVIVTVFTGLTAEWLVDSIDGLTASGNISREFVALILLPLVGNAAEHVTAVTVSVKDKLDLSLAVAVGSSIQISLFVIPLLVLLGWCIGQPLTLQFDVFETITLFVSIVIVNQAISDGKSNWMEGMLLMMTYLVIAVAFFFYPGTGELV